MASEGISKAEEIVEDTMVIEETEGEKPEVKHSEPKLARVEYDYEARESDELSLDKGAVVTVLEQGDEGWWKGDLNGKIGTFPSNHVKLIEVQSKPVEDGDDAEHQDGKKKKTLNKYGVKPGGLGSLFSGGITIGLKKRNQQSSENSSGSEEKHAIASAPVLRKASTPSHPLLPHLPPKRKPSKPNKVEPKAEVLYGYDADGDDEISLIEGAHVIILEKLDEDGWWKGRNEQGHIGIFPSTYVNEIKSAEVQHKSQPISEQFIESNVEETKRHESSETQATAPQEETSTHEPTLVSSDSPLSLIHPNVHETCEIYGEDSPTLPVSPPLMRRTTNETSSPPKSNRRSTYDTSQADAPRRRSVNVPTSPTSPTSPRRNSSYDGNENTTSKRPPSVVSPDLPPIQSISTNSNSVTNIDIPHEEHPTIPPRQSDSPKSPPPLTKQPSIPKSFSPAKPPVIPPIKRSSSSASKSDITKKETSPTEPISPKIDRRVSYDSSTALSEEPEYNIDEDEQIDEDVEKPEKIIVEEKIDNKNLEISEEEVVNDDKDSITEAVETKEDGIAGIHEIEPEEKKPPPQLPLPPLPSGPKLSHLGKDRPTIKNRKAPSVNSAKENANQSQTAILLEAVASAKGEEEQKPQPVVSPSTPPKPEKPAKPSGFKLPTLGGNIQLRPVAKKQPIETPAESMETTTISTASNIDTKPISGGVKGISSRFNQFGGIPSSSDVEFRLKKWFNEEINKVKSHFEVQLAEERNKREVLEEQLKELIASLQE
ncbi:743_t:CDS:2 [Funneliformis geosporum]|nr:743_t:CDS:2 [Funneliformis geosporum]